MRYAGSQARRIDNAATWQANQPVLVPIEGGRSGHRDGVRGRGTSLVSGGALGYVVALVLVLFVAGGISVALISGTVGRLRSNQQTRAQIEELSEYNDDLRVDRSMLTRTERIATIAEQNLGMTYASDAKEIELT